MKNIYIITTEDPLFSIKIINAVHRNFKEELKGIGFSGGLITFRRIFLSPFIYGFINYIIFGLKVIFGLLGYGKIRSYCKLNELSFDELHSVKDGKLMKILKEKKIDLLLLVNCSRKIHEPELSYPKYGTINIHFGELPTYRGLMTILQAIRRGENKNGVTVHYADEILDNGDIIDCQYVSISKSDDLISVWKKATELGAEMIVNFLRHNNTIGRNNVKKNDVSKSNYYSFPSIKQILDYRLKIFLNKFR